MASVAASIAVSRTALRMRQRQHTKLCYIAMRNKLSDLIDERFPVPPPPITNPPSTLQGAITCQALERRLHEGVIDLRCDIVQAVCG